MAKMGTQAKAAQPLWGWLENRWLCSNCCAEEKLTGDSHKEEGKEGGPEGRRWDSGKTLGSGPCPSTGSGPRVECWSSRSVQTQDKSKYPSAFQRRLRPGWASNGSRAVQVKPSLRKVGMGGSFATTETNSSVVATLFGEGNPHNPG